MSANSAIQWTDHTFNPWWGCMKVSPGCAHCYADTLSTRFGFDVWGPPKTTERRLMSAHYWNDPRRWNRAAEKAGQRARVFCASMADVFEEHPTADAERPKLWELIRATPWLDWQLLTKRPERIAAHLPDDWGSGYPNVWLGTSVEDQQRADERIPHLLAVPARVRFLSCEPLLGPVDLDRYLTGHEEHGVGHTVGACVGWTPPVDWVIVGGESGPQCRPMDAMWAEGIVDDCRVHRVAVFVKQLGGHPDKRGEPESWPSHLRVREMPA